MVKVAVSPVLMLSLVTLHWPASSVVHSPDPVALSLHWPLTVTAGIG
jgi:hypothetical protein